MFERFTRGAREAVERAQDEARAIGSPSIGTAEMLLGVAGGDGPGARALAAQGATYDALRARVVSGGLDGDALASIGVDLDEIRRRAEANFGPGALERRRRPKGSHVPFTPEGKKALELALREAIALGDKRDRRRARAARGAARGRLGPRCCAPWAPSPRRCATRVSPAASRRGRGG